MDCRKAENALLRSTDWVMTQDQPSIKLLGLHIDKHFVIFLKLIILLD